MSHPQHQLRAFIENGPHAGETLSIDPDSNGQAPARIELDAPADRGALGDRTKHAPDTGAVSARPTAYTRDHADQDLGVWGCIESHPANHDRPDVTGIRAHAARAEMCPLADPRPRWDGFRGHAFATLGGHEHPAGSEP